ncbi:hypothetical protein ACSNOD_31765, partial [Streptomyces sp. URMC 123]
MARTVAACLPTVALTRPGPASGAVLRAATLTITGLLCSPATGVCAADRMEADHLHLHHPGPGGGSCLRARRTTLTDGVRFRAEQFSGRVFGLLPLALSTRRVPPVRIPYLVVTDARAHGLWARAGTVVSETTTTGPAPAPA